MEKVRAGFFAGIALFAAGTCAYYASNANLGCEPYGDDYEVTSCRGNGAAALFALAATVCYTIAAVSSDTKEVYQSLFLIGLGFIAAIFGAQFSSSANINCESEFVTDDNLCTAESVSSAVFFVAFVLSLVSVWFLHIQMSNKAYAVFLFTLAAISGGFVAAFAGNASSLKNIVDDTTGDIQTFYEKLLAGNQYATYGNALAFLSSSIIATVLLVRDDDDGDGDEKSTTGLFRLVGWLTFLIATAAGFGGLAWMNSDATCFLDDQNLGDDSAKIQCENFKYVAGFNGLCVIFALIGCFTACAGGKQVWNFSLSFALGWLFLSLAMGYQVDAQTSCETSDDDQADSSCYGFSIAAAVTFLGGFVCLASGVLCFFEDKLSW